MDPKRIEPAKQISQRRPLLCPYFIPYPLNSRACITFHHLKDETVRLLDLKYKVTEICKEKHLMEELEPTEAGKPLAEFIKEMSDPNRKTRYLGWKTKADVPPFLQAKEKSLVTAPELHFLLRCGPTVRGAFTEVFRQDGYLRSKFHSQLYLARDGKFLLPALALHSINPTIYLGNRSEKGQRENPSSKPESKPENPVLRISD
ncbi:hypothetical protein N7519_004053 [Penicillium mononematosum]|uniref:uncharacterized protein n=1 Tax=Penicillium mononematosum TaxID=268346 RepID=UPI002547E858|nr:uncharacterized protein N7519_004053 [Penicillium mononematosum]KAJ6189145.1 hypothetical protein N7519_004053 [Penicillium mononematosum]